MNRKIINVASVFLILIFLQACSAGGGETGTGQNGTIQNHIAQNDTNISVGVITGFGSVYVNGIRFKTNENTVVSIDGEVTALESQLSVGMLVTISGNVDAGGVTGNASSIVFEDNVEGFVIDNSLSTGGVLNVMGQVIIPDNDTIFQSDVVGVNDVLDIVPNHIVEVSGYSNGDGIIYATRIVVKSDNFQSGEINVKGTVVSLSSASFTIGGDTASMIVNYTNDVLEGFSLGELKVGDFVSVKSQSGFDLNNALTATEVMLKENDRLSDLIEVDKEIEFEGVVSQFNSATNTFLLNAESILLTENTVFKDSMLIDLKDRSRIKIHGVLNSSGIIVATSVNVKPVSKTYYEGVVTRVDVANGIVELLGVTVYLNSLTRLQDDRENDADVSPAYDKQKFNLSDLKTGDTIEVSVFTSTFEPTFGRLFASKLERKDTKMAVPSPDGLGGIERKIEGVISGYTGSNTLMVSGVMVDIQTAIMNDLINGVLANGVVVEIQGIKTAGGWFAIEIEVKQPENEKPRFDGGQANEINKLEE